MPESFAEHQERVREMAREKYPFIPNQIRVLNKHSPAAAETYIATMNAIEDGQLEPHEREAVILAISRYNDCHYCARTHAFLGSEAGLSKEAIEAIHRGGLPDEPRLRALVQATRLLLDKRGWLEREEVDELTHRSIGRTELYEINVLIGLKIFSNYVNHVARTEVDESIQQAPNIQEMWPVIGDMKWQGDGDAPATTH
ncbi:MAG: carboxymuconolactone decarboxylase family protein [Bacteroidetes bacterium]|jgi:AhpD family alkylhydroperoxidase|nr:carboxymuconolactone decarboxylase family protein [Bacteroidota bacterium]